MFSNILSIFSIVIASAVAVFEIVFHSRNTTKNKKKDDYREFLASYGAYIGNSKRVNLENLLRSLNAARLSASKPVSLELSKLYFELTKSSMCFEKVQEYFENSVFAINNELMGNRKHKTCNR